MSWRALLFGAAATALALVGCGGQEDEQLAKESGAAVDGSCKESDLSSGDRCDGAWEFEFYVTPCSVDSVQDSRCPIDTSCKDNVDCVQGYPKKPVNVYRTCRDPSFGMEVAASGLRAMAEESTQYNGTITNWHDFDSASNVTIIDSLDQSWGEGYVTLSSANGYDICSRFSNINKQGASSGRVDGTCSLLMNGLIDQTYLSVGANAYRDTQGTLFLDSTPVSPGHQLRDAYHAVAGLITNASCSYCLYPKGCTMMGGYGIPGHSASFGESTASWSGWSARYNACLWNVQRWKAKAQLPCPVLRTDYLPDTSKSPLYQKCVLQNLDLNPGRCGTQGGKQYSDPGLTRSGLFQYPHAAAGDAVCLTADNLSSPTLKYERLIKTLNALDAGTYGSASRYPLSRDQQESLRKKVLAKLRLLLELHGAELSDQQRSVILHYAQMRPDVLPACGTKPTQPATSGGYTRVIDFEDAKVLPADPETTAGSKISISTTAHGGSKSLKLGEASSAATSTAVLDFGVPTSGGRLSFYVQSACSSSNGNGATAWIKDFTTSTRTTILSATCTGAGIWKSVGYDLAPYAGHNVTLYLSNMSAVGASYALFDDISFPSTATVAYGVLAECQRLLDPGLTPANSALLRWQCIDAAGLATSPKFEGWEEYADRYKSVVNSYLQKVQEIPLTSGTEGKPNPELQERLALVDRWYRNAVSLYASDQKELLWNQVSQVVGSTWKGVHASAISSFESSTQCDGEAFTCAPNSTFLQSYANASLARDRELLTSMFSDWSGSGEPPLTSPPALLFLADGIRALTERLDGVASYHDLACRFMRCADRGVRTEVSSLYRLLGAVADQNLLSSEMTSGNIDARAWAKYYTPSWKLYWSTLDLIQKRHADVIQRAVKEAVEVTGTYDAKTMVLNADDSSSSPVVGFAAAVISAAKRGDDYRNTGLILSRSAKSLPTGLLAAKIWKIDTNVSDSLDKVDSSLKEYRDAQARYVNGLIGESDGSVAANDVNTRKKALVTRAYNLATDDAGMKISATTDQVRYMRLAQSLRDMPDSTGKSYVTPIGDPVTYTFNGADGRYPGAIVSDVTLLAKKTPAGMYRVLTGQPGQMLTIRAEGVYEPTCALVMTQGKFYGINLSDGNGGLAAAAAGAGGFRLQYASEEFQTNAITNTTSDTWTRSIEACGGLDLSKALGGDLLGLSASVKACLRYAHEESWSSSDSRGAKASSSAAFSLGLRLSNTPFPNYPAGAVLAVLLKPGSVALSDILDVQVVGQPQAVITFGQEADLYFVVNDLSCVAMGMSPTTNNTLELEWQLLAPQAVEMEMVAQAMGEIEPYVQRQADAIIGQGRLLSGDTVRIKNNAWQELRVACEQCNLDTMSSVVRSYFEGWIDYRIAQIERAIETISIVREMDAVLLETGAIERDVELFATKGRYASLLPLLSLRNLEYANENLSAAATEVTRVVTEELYPMVYLRYPEVFQKVSVSALEPLLAIDWVSAQMGGTSTSGSIAGLVATAVNEVKNALDNAVLLSVDPSIGDVSTALVAVRFPNPWNPPPPAQGEVQPPGRAVVDGRSLALWKSLLEGVALDTESDSECCRAGGNPSCCHTLPKLSWEIRPTDLYDPYGPRAGMLSCYMVAPAIRSMQAYLVTTASGVDVMNGQLIAKVTGTGRLMTFMGSTGLERFSLDNEDFLQTGQTKLIFGKESAWADTYHRYPPDRKSVTGVSPVGKFSMNSPGYAGDRWWDSAVDVSPFVYSRDGQGALVNPDRTMDFVVIMEIEARRATTAVGGVPGVPGCDSSLH
jgi:hypothetical protein